MGHQPKLGSYGKHRIFWQKTEILGQKNRYHFLILTMFWTTTGKSCSKKKSAFAQIIKGEMSFWVIFWGKTHFLGQKPLFRPNVKMPVSPWFRPGPGPLSFYVIFFMARTIPPSFVEIGPKLRVVAPLTRRWPTTAKNRGEPQKMTPSSETLQKYDTSSFIHNIS